MSYVVVKYPDEPIMVTTIDLPLENHLSGARQVWAMFNQQAEECTGVFYGIIDLSSAHMSFSDILIWLDERTNTPGMRFKAPRLRTIMVGTHPLIALCAKKLQQHFGEEILYFATLNEALAHARSQSGIPMFQPTA